MPTIAQVLKAAILADPVACAAQAGVIKAAVAYVNNREPTMLLATVGDSVSPADVVTTAALYARAVADAVAATDVVATSRALNSSVADTAAATDGALTIAMAFNQSVADSVTPADALSTAFAFARSVADSVTPADAVTPVISGATLNPSDKSPSLTLSNGNLTATRNTVTASRWVSARSTTSHSAGKYYIEATNDHTNTSSVFCTILGIANSTFNVDDGTTQCWVGDDANSVGVQSFNGNIVTGGTTTLAVIAAWSGTGSLCCMAVDLDNRKIWFRSPFNGNWNNSGTANPATNTGGFALPSGVTGAAFIAVSAFQTAAPIDQITVNFGASTFVGAVPSGFGAW